MVISADDATSDNDAFTNILRLIVLSSGDYFILKDTVSDIVVHALQQHCDFLAKAFHSRLGTSSAPLTLPRLIASLSDCKLHLSRISTYLSTYVFATHDLENLDSDIPLSETITSKALTVFRTECKKLKIHLDESATLPPSLISGQHIRMERIDGFATRWATTEQYLEFTRLRQRTRLLGRPFDAWLARAGISIQRSTGGVEAVPILAYLVTQCVKDLIDVALANRQKFGIDLYSQMTAVELQRASLLIQRMNGYL